VPDEITFAHVSGGLIAPSLLASLRRETAKGGVADPAGFARNGYEPTAAQVRDDAEFAFANLADRWDNLSSTIDELDLPRVRERWLLPLLQELHFEPRFQRADLEFGGERFKISHLGWDGPNAPLLLLVKDGLDDRPGVQTRSAHEELQAALNHSEQHTWGIVANARRLRLVRDFHHRRKRGYVEFELDAIFESRSFGDFLSLYRLGEATRFRWDGNAEPLLEHAYRASLEAGIAIGRNLQPQVLKALEALANGVLTPSLREKLTDPAEARALYRELLTFLYRILFLLFAEQRGLLSGSDLYRESYSVTRLRELAETGGVERRRADLWEGLKVTFRALSGNGAEELGVFAFNGPLFDRSRTPTLNSVSCPNHALLRAIRELTTVELDEMRQFVNFAELGVEELGAVYESLLDYAPVVTTSGIELKPMADERKDLGSYYTPAALVDLVLQKSLDVLIQERLEVAGDDHQEREAALLDIKVCDPACGSAAFLVGAVDRLALAVSEARRQGAPSEEDLRLARRDVLQHCIYGVDKDPMAVELAKVALWIHCAVENLPLTFLDHRIQHGDALVGWGFQKLPDEIPSGAYDKPAWKALNSPQLVVGEEHPPVPDPHLALPPLEDQPEASPTDIEAKAAAYRAYLNSPGVRRWSEIADLWTAAFFWDEAGGLPPTTRDYWSALAGNRPRHTEHAVALGRFFPFFHWALRLPEIRERGGFDCVVGNPPWEQIKPSELEWFAARDATIAGLKGAERKHAIAELKHTNPALAASWEAHTRVIRRQAEFVRRCGRFTPSGGEANTYLLFTELAADHLRADGRAGILVKSALAIDKSGQPVFQRLLKGRRLSELHDVVNGGPTGTNMIFPAVDGKHRFSLVALGPAGRSDAFRATVMNWNLEEVTTRTPQLFTDDVLRTLNPRTCSLTSFRTAEELAVALDIHQRLPILDFEKGGDNPWGLSYHTLFHSTGDSEYFLKRETLEAEGWGLGDDKIFRRGNDIALPLYEGQMANRYDHRARTYEGYSGEKKYQRSPGIPIVTDEEKANPSFEVEPRYWIFKATVDKRFAETIGERITIGFRDVVHHWRTQRATMGAILPRYPATHTLPILAAPRERVCAFLAIFNSTVFDFLVRGHMPGAHVALTWMLSQIAVPLPDEVAGLAHKAERLSRTSRSVARLFDAEPETWDAAARYQLEIEIDAAVATAYGLDRSQYEVVFDALEVMGREEERKYGYHKFKTDCLAVFDGRSI
jgi:hypothetical protein